MCEKRRSLGLSTPASAIQKGIPTASGISKTGFSCAGPITRSVVLQGALNERLQKLVRTAEKLPMMIYTGGFEADLARAAGFRESLL